MPIQRTITLTRPHPLNDALITPLKAAGWLVHVCPLIEIAQPTTLATTQAALQQLQNNDIVIACSPTAVTWAHHHLTQLGLEFPKTPHYIAIGAGTAQTLQSFGIERPEHPTHKQDALSILELPTLQTISQKAIACLQGENPKTPLSHILQQRGAKAHAINCYQRLTPPHIDWEQILDSDAVLISSSSALKEFYRNSSKIHKCSLKYPYILVHHEDVYRMAKQWGFNAYLLARLDSDNLLQALASIPSIHHS